MRRRRGEIRNEKNGWFWTHVTCEQKQTLLAADHAKLDQKLSPLMDIVASINIFFGTNF